MYPNGLDISTIPENFTPEIFKLSEVSLKSEPHQRMLDRQTLLENKIAAVTRLSREVQNVSDPSEVAPKTSETLETLKTEEGQLNNGEILQTEESQLNNRAIENTQIYRYYGFGSF
ncbi:unnamed protein product [Rhizophagus irregularis]|nr:unnamed protein product [Rhizophagus irregularis]